MTYTFESDEELTDDVFIVSKDGKTTVLVTVEKEEDPD